MAQKPTTTRAQDQVSLEDIAAQSGVYPPEAYEFVQQGLAFTTKRVHGGGGKTTRGGHVTGQQLSEGLRDYAQMLWGLMARLVLAKWNITSTYDFGRIVYVMLEHKLLGKTQGDCIEDFRNVYDFASLDQSYHMESKL